MLTSTEIKAAQAFWKWFEENRLPFEFVGNMEPEQVDEISDRIHEAVAPYCEAISPIAGSQISKKEGFRLVLSAAGQRAYFGKAKELAALAPDIPNWEVLALLPPLPRDIQIRYEYMGELIYPDDLWCQLLDSPDNPSFLGIHISLKLYDHCPDEEALQELQSFIIQVVAQVIGEESLAMDIQHLQLAPLPPYPTEQEGMFNLYDLPQQIAEFRKEHPSPWEGE